MWSSVLVVATVGTACVGGVVYAFSAFVMPALSKLAPSDAIRAMQSINVFAERAPLGLAILVPAVAVIALSIKQAVDWHGTESVLILVGSALYLVVGLGVTAAVNVPLNNRLALAAPTVADAAATWQAFAQPWVAANHLRSAGALLASAVFAVSGLIAGR